MFIWCAEWGAPPNRNAPGQTARRLRAQMRPSRRRAASARVQRGRDRHPFWRCCSPSTATRASPALCVPRQSPLGILKNRIKRLEKLLAYWISFSIFEWAKRIDIYSEWVRAPPQECVWYSPRANSKVYAIGSASQEDDCIAPDRLNQQQVTSGIRIVTLSLRCWGNMFFLSKEQA